MRFRTSVGKVRLTLLAAIGMTAGSACSGTVHDGIRQATTDGGEPEAASAGAGGNGSGSGGTASGGTGGTTSGGAASGGSAGAPESCVNPVPIVSSVTGLGPTGGFVRCESGLVHRTAVDACWNNVGPADAGVTIPAAPDGSFTIGCHTNSDCTEAPYGYCAQDPIYGAFPPPDISCHYGCVKDEDCATDQICRCGEPLGQCVQASCKSDGDCEGGRLCRETWIGTVCGPSQIEYRCTPLCVVDADCVQTGSYPMDCREGNCVPQAVCGRPFLVGGEARLAASEQRGDWAELVAPDVSSLSVEARHILAAHYTDVGLMEHASIAAFARFTLELLSLGAPAELVQLATEALADETRHARVCFGLAAAYGGVPVGPGPLTMESVLTEASLEERVKIAFLEACIGETLAAVEVAEAAKHATDPAASVLLSRIAADETRHAALGFRFVSWMLDSMQGARRRALEADLLAALRAEVQAASVAVSSNASSGGHLAAHGLLPAAIRAELRNAAMHDVVVPCVHALLGHEAPRVAA